MDLKLETPQRFWLLPNLKGVVGGKKEMLGQWNRSGITAIADNGVCGGNKGFVSGGWGLRKRTGPRLSAKHVPSHKSSTLVSRTIFRLRIVNVIILVR